MKTKYLINGITILMVIIMNVGIVSCGDNGSDDEVSIVGTWKCDWSDGYSIITFNANGTGNYTDKEGVKITSEMFKYVFDTKTMTLILMFWDDEEKDYTEYDEPAHISSLTSKTMIIDGYTYVRQ